MTFKDMNISEAVCRALREKEYETPTPIQEQAIPEALKGRDVLGLAQTGTGKTAAFAIPIIEQLMAAGVGEQKGRQREIRALILTPTRELAIQIEESFADYAKHTPLRHTVIFGGVGQKPQTDALRGGIDILTATPGRLLDLMSQGFVHLDGIRHFVLDEADRMLDMGFIHDIKRILPKLPKEKQTLFFSATMPDSIASLSKSLLHNPIRVEVTPASSVVDTISQCVYMVEKPQKKVLLAQLLQSEKGHSVLVFSRTKHGADNIARILTKKGIPCESIHGNKSQNARQRALKNFKEGRSNVIVATDIAARGIDIKELDLVLNYDLPDVPETYVHRIGRTGRAGHEGRAISFCAEDERPMLRDIEKLTNKRLPVQAHDLPPMDVASETAVQPRKPERRQQQQRGSRRNEPASVKVERQSVQEDNRQKSSRGRNNRQRNQQKSAANTQPQQAAQQARPQSQQQERRQKKEAHRPQTDNKLRSRYEHFE